MTKYTETMHQVAIDGALSWIDDLIAAQKAGVIALERSRATFLDIARPQNNVNKSALYNPTATPVSALGWVVNEVGNVSRNMRLDLAVHHASALALSAKKD